MTRHGALYWCVQIAVCVAVVAVVNLIWHPVQVWLFALSGLATGISIDLARWGYRKHKSRSLPCAG